MRERLRPAYSPEELQTLYDKPHDHWRWKDHHIRVDVTIAIATWMHEHGAIADLSCGDAHIANEVSRECGGVETILGDYAPGYLIQGPLEDTLEKLPHVGMYICSETIEHLDDPDAVLKQIHAKADTLVLSTPIGETVDDGNPEHYWGWDTDGVGDMLFKAGWQPHVLNRLELNAYAYDYQIWGCRKWQ